MRPSHVIAAIAIGWMAAVAIIAGLLISRHDSALERAKNSSAALALVMEEHTERTFQSVDLTLAAVADALLFAPELPKNDPGFRRWLTQRMVGLPYVRAIFVIGPDGHILHDTDYPRTPDISLADRPYFITHRANPDLQRNLSPPIQSRAGLGWFVAQTRRIGQGGPFRGIVVAAVVPEYFEELYGRMGLARGDIITLFHRGGALMALQPRDTAQIGASFAKYALFTTYLPRDDSGTYMIDSGMFPFARVVSYRQVEGFPLVVAIAQSMDVILAEWRKTAWAAGIATAILTALLTALIAQYLREKRRRDLSRERRAQAEKLEALGHLTAGIAHDFANLLNIVAVNLRIVSVQPGDERTRRAASLADHAVARGIQLVQRLLAFARRQPLKVHAADLSAMVESARDLLMQAAGPSVELVTELAEGLPPCLADETQLEVALVNLVVNAKDAMSGQGRIVIRTRDCSRAELRTVGPAEPSQDYVCIEVEDNGPGMSEETVRHALEPFFTTKGEGGTGLGLSQVYGFMQQIGGNARIESRPGTGTTVRLFFPKAPPGSTPTLEPAESELESDGNSSGTRAQAADAARAANAKTGEALRLP